MKDEQTLIRTVNGKTVYLLKITDQIATKVNHHSDNIRSIDSTLKSWKEELNKFGKIEKCHYDSSSEFLSHFAFDANKVFSSILRWNTGHN